MVFDKKNDKQDDKQDDKQNDNKKIPLYQFKDLSYILR